MFKSDTLEIKELEIDELEQAFPVISQLRPHLNFKSYLEIVKTMKTSGYTVACLFEGKNIVSYIGYANLTNLYNGSHVWVYDLVTDESKRGNGYGKLLLDYVEKWAEKNKISCVVLSSGLQRTTAHKFYEKGMSYSKTSYVFKKEITT